MKRMSRAMLIGPLGRATAMLLTSATMLCGCTTVRVEEADPPHQPRLAEEAVAAPETPNVRLQCAVESALPAIYWPTVLAPKDEQAAPPCSATYDAEVVYDDEQAPVALSLFNPLVLVGFPTGNSAVTARARLTVNFADNANRTYTAEVRAQTTEGLYSAANNAELRKRALMEVRREIDGKVRIDPPPFAAYSQE